MKLKPFAILPRAVFSLLVVVVVSSCAVIPAKLRIDRRAVGDGGSLPGLLEIVVADREPQEASDALGRFVAKWFSERDAAASGEVVDGATRYRVKFVAEGAGSYLPDYFDRIEPTVGFKIRGIEHHKRSGIGAPLLAVRENTGREEIERFYPPEAIARPLTAVAETKVNANGVREISVRLLCPLCFETVTVDGSSRPMAADFSVPWAALLGRSRGLVRAEVRDVLRRKPSRSPQLFLMEPYDPEKEPLVMIHGLLDTPLKWAQLSNDLWALEDMRERYQIWHYLYNTSAPALYSGRILRNQLRELRLMLDPEQDDPAMQRTTLLTHSMGGIVGRSLITRPGEAFWDAAMKRPMDELSLSPEDRASLGEAFYWEPESHVKRVIFVAVPHRGSDRVDSLAGKIGRVLVGPPPEFRQFYERVSASNPGVFTPAYEELGRGRLDSVHSLSPQQPTLKIFAEMRPHHRVDLHSIIGNRGKDEPLADSHDDLVPYWSSHLDYADSEKVVPAGHDAFRHPEGRAEIFRLLRLPK